MEEGRLDVATIISTIRKIDLFGCNCIFSFFYIYLYPTGFVLHIRFDIIPIK